MNKSIALLVFISLLVGCSSPPTNPDNLCAIFREKDDWYGAAADARDNWNSPIPVMMAIMHQESSFQSDAQPPRTYLFGFIPWTRPSDAYGYPQAKDATWKGYQRSSGNWGADRDDFEDAIDFIGWYNNQSYKKCSIKRDDPYHLYLAYHEGHGGFNRRTFKEKQWLKDVAKKVSARSRRYTSQLNNCEESLKASWWEFWR